MALQNAELSGQALGPPGIVGVEERDPLPARRPDAGIAGRSGAGVLLADQAQPVVAGGAGEGAAAVGAAVVDHDQLEVGEGLGEDRADRAGDVRRLVVERDHDAHRRRGARPAGGGHRVAPVRAHPPAWPGNGARRQASRPSAARSSGARLQNASPR